MEIRPLEMNADQALFAGKIQGLVATFYENERPLQGLAGLMDWRFHGVISRALRAGSIAGSESECVYIPVRRHERTFHLILVGGGRLSPYGRRGLLSDQSFEVLRRNLASLRLPEVGFSQSDLGGLNEDYVSKKLKGLPLWMVP